MFLFGLILNSALAMKAQCPQGSVILTTQNQVDSFLIMYPVCDSIFEDLEIGSVNTSSTFPSTNIVQLDGLSNISYVELNLGIANNDSIVNLDGLQNVKEIGQSLLIFYNDSLLTFTGLDSLESIGFGLFVHFNNNYRPPLAKVN